MILNFCFVSLFAAKFEGFKIYFLAVLGIVEWISLLCSHNPTNDVSL